MNTSQKIAKLEALLARVQSRATAPRSGPVVIARAAQPAPVIPPAPPTPAPPTVQPESEPLAAPAAARAATLAFSEPPNAAAADEFFQTVPPAAADDDEVSEAELAEAELAAVAAAEGDVESVDLNADDVEVSSEVVEVDIDVDESGAAAVVAMESGAQPVAAAASPDELEEVEEHENAGDADEAEEAEAAARTSAPPPIGAPTEEVAHVAANELEEPVPSSSRRPVASEAPEAEAYEEESAPRHTPPPESGKQVAAPSVNPAPRKSSFPPDSLEGHTLIGGWREPGLPGGPPAGPSPVRVPAPGAAFAPPTAGPSPVAPPQMGPPSTLGAMPGPKPARLAPEVVRPELPAGGRVATLEGTAPTFKPANFGELLDATLAL